MHDPIETLLTETERICRVPQQGGSLRETLTLQVERLIQEHSRHIDETEHLYRTGFGSGVNAAVVASRPPMALARRWSGLHDVFTQRVSLELLLEEMAAPPSLEYLSDGQLLELYGRLVLALGSVRIPGQQL